MTNYSSVLPFQSKLVPDLSYQLRKMSHGRRMKYNEISASVRAKIDENQQLWKVQWDQIDAARKAAELEPCICESNTIPLDPKSHKHSENRISCEVVGCSCRKINVPDGVVKEEFRLRQFIWNNLTVGELYPIMLRWGIESISGFQIDGQDATVDSILNLGHDDIVAEVAQEIERVMGLTFEEQMGFKLPGTGSTQMTGPTENTSA